MSVPLNIDWQQILLHLFNFVILALGLYLLLYKPVRDYMENRTAEYERREKETADALADAKATEESARERLSAIDNEIEAKRQAAADATAKQTESDLQAAKKKAEKIISDARAQAAAEKQRAVADAQKEIAQLAADACEKLLKEAERHE